MWHAMALIQDCWDLGEAISSLSHVSFLWPMAHAPPLASWRLPQWPVRWFGASDAHLRTCPHKLSCLLSWQSADSWGCGDMSFDMFWWASSGGMPNISAISKCLNARCTIWQEMYLDVRSEDDLCPMRSSIHTSDSRTRSPFKDCLPGKMT